jgi:hypothetical protein
MNDESDSSDDMNSGQSESRVAQNFNPNPHSVTIVKTTTGEFSYGLIGSIANPVFSRFLQGSRYSRLT